MNVRRIMMLLVFLFSIGTLNSFAQTKKKSKAKTQKVHKVRNRSTDDGEYYNGHRIYIGPRGGRYYINRNGNKTYI
jgi:colicin import membrane protein